MKYSPKDFEGALNSLADTLGIRLTMSGKTPFGVDGGGVHKIELMGESQGIPIHIEDSFVDTTRGVILLDVILCGDLSMVLLADSESLRMSVFLFDRSKISRSIVIPLFWIRQRLYEAICPGLKVTYERGFYDQSWTIKERGNAWMLRYLEDKKQAAANASVQTAARQIL